MAEKSLKRLSLLGIIWGLLEKFSTQLVTLVVGVILARLLSPSDYGLIAITEIFLIISQLIVDSGFTSALIRKKNRSDIDYSTVFDINVGLSAIMALLLCISSSFISDFYHEKLLVDIICFNGLYIFLGSFISVQAIKMQAEMRFKEKSKITIFNSVIKGVVSVFMAFSGYGVWSLIFPNLVMIFVSVFFYWHYQHWFPGIKFSYSSAKELFSFGSKILLSTIINTIYTNLYPMIIGKKFNSSDLGFYSKGNAYANLPSTTITNVIGNVAYPALSKIQDDDQRLKSIYRKMLRLSAYMVFPIMITIFVLAHPLIVLLITEKWTPCIVFLQVLCLASMWYPIHGLNLNLLQVKGRSDLFLRLEIIKKIVGVAIIIITIPYGLYWISFGSVCGSLIGLFINTYYTGKIIKLGFLNQMLDLAPSLLYSVSMGVVIWGVTLVLKSLCLQLFVGCLVGAVYYIIISYIFKSQELKFLKELIFSDFILLKKS